MEPNSFYILEMGGGEGYKEVTRKLMALMQIAM